MDKKSKYTMMQCGVCNEKSLCWPLIKIDVYEICEKCFDKHYADKIKVCRTCDTLITPYRTSCSKCRNNAFDELAYATKNSNGIKILDDITLYDSKVWLIIKQYIYIPPKPLCMEL